MAVDERGEAGLVAEIVTLLVIDPRSHLKDMADRYVAISAGAQFGDIFARRIVERFDHPLVERDADQQRGDRFGHREGNETVRRPRTVAIILEDDLAVAQHDQRIGIGAPRPIVIAAGDAARAEGGRGELRALGERPDGIAVGDGAGFEHVRRMAEIEGADVGIEPVLAHLDDRVGRHIGLREGRRRRDRAGEEERGEKAHRTSCDHRILMDMIWRGESDARAARRPVRIPS